MTCSMVAAIKSIIGLIAHDRAKSCYWQLEIKTSSMKRVRRSPELAAVRFNDCAAYRESHPHSTVLRRKEGIKNTVHVSRINRKRFDDPTPPGSYDRVLKRVGIQYWRISSTTAGMSL